MTVEGENPNERAPHRQQKEKKYSKEKGGLDDNHSLNLVQAKRQTQKGRSVEATRLQRGGILD